MHTKENGRLAEEAEHLIRRFGKQCICWSLFLFLRMKRAGHNVSLNINFARLSDLIKLDNFRLKLVITLFWR